MAFTRATKHEAKLRMALIGPPGSGKTYTALAIAAHFGRVALIDTEHGSASKYGDIFNFDSDEPEDYHPERYVNMIREAERAGYDALVIDSLSHAWMGRGGALSLVDAAAKRKGGNSFAAWGEVTPLQNKLIDAILASRLHIIATVRSKIEHVQEKDPRTNATIIKKLGLQPQQREGLEYEFDIVATLDNNMLSIDKSRCPELQNQTFYQAGEEVATILKGWLKGAPLPTMQDVYAFGADNGLAPDDVKQILQDGGYTGFLPSYFAGMKQAIIDALAREAQEEEPTV